MNIIPWLIEQDRALFLWVNQLRIALLDSLMPLFMDWTSYWVLVAFCALVLGIRGGKRVWFALAAFGVLVSCVDLLNSGVLKPLFGRSRPYETLPDVRVFWNGWMRWEPLRDASIGETISFPSSHAANSFAAAVFLGATFKSLRMGFFTAAAVISFSRVYVGVRYPLDVIAGAMVGIFSGVLFLRMARIVWSALSGWKGSVRFHRWVESMSSEDRRHTDYYWPGVFLLAGAAWAWRHWETPASSYGTVFPIRILLASVGLCRVALSLKRMHSVRGKNFSWG